ncbi:MAG TPA: hypothetical protein PLI12_09805 [Acetobacteraceae bacterium]|nr:hypothetical protein [Acetobacteraceae bacterium]
MIVFQNLLRWVPIMLLAMIAATLLFALLLYPLIVAQISLLAGQLPSSIASAQQLASHEMSVLQARLGHGVISQKLQDLAGDHPDCGVLSAAGLAGDCRPGRFLAAALV